MMQYRNKRTGVIVEVWSEVSGEWEKVEEQPSPVSDIQKKEKRKAPKKTKKEGQ